MKAAAIIAAAGDNRSDAGFSPLLCLSDCTALEGMIASFREAGVEKVVVVIGHRAEVLERTVSSSAADVIFNPNYATTGMLDSVRLGLSYLNGGWDPVFITPGDIPLVSPKTLKSMMAVPSAAVRPVYREEIGHPLLIRGQLREELMICSDRGGLAAALEEIGDITDLPVDDRGVVMGLDSKEDLKEMRKKLSTDLGGGLLRPEISVNLLRSETVLSPFSVLFLEMLDKTGSIRTACECVSVSYSKGWRLLNDMERELGWPLVNRSTGGTGGGGASLTERGRELLEDYRRYREKLIRYANAAFREVFGKYEDESIEG